MADYLLVLLIGMLFGFWLGKRWATYAEWWSGFRYQPRLIEEYTIPDHLKQTIKTH
ncbi:hypothetical protein [Ferrovum myxofaciens]|uniref:Uncharacterized protein n=1 Tax=Ferrovum myxofaciens TaxID=416213 RepID=A0A9E6N092_9PROT|nr:hypothetical protein [Ferrovum myxofaciens]QKE37929.1 MAG: hypothetical protein HO273_03605 [Ferrovum myxofaciens]QWY75620.1 MAG: hypothetical protein JVY19_04080 [Ferrovum myxofaciens]QWY78357.1 MAG: hypothetical protein JZL65_04585 [Ferrovum myxofaciens]